MTSILAFGAYVPRQRLERRAIAGAHAWFAPGLRGLAKGERAFGSWDEDPVTMAVEAARNCLDGRDRDEIDGIVLASATAPFAERQNAAIVKEALTLRDDVFAMDCGGGQRAGLSALIQSLRGGAGRQTLCIASDRPLALPASEDEMHQGDAAAAFVLGDGPGVAEVLATHAVTFDFVDRHREQDRDHSYSWESRWVREEAFGRIVPEAIGDALQKAGIAASDISHFIMPSPLKGAQALVCRKTGIPAEAATDTFAATIGEAGSAHAPLMLSHVLETAEAGKIILAAGFGSGCDVLILRRTEGGHRPRLTVSDWLARREVTDNYMKFLVFNDRIAIEKGMRAEFDQKQPMTALWRNRKAVLGLIGGRCTQTGAVQFPKSDISVNPNAHAVGTQEDYKLAERQARIVTYTADRLTYTLDPPGCYGMIEFDGGGRMYAEFCDADADALEVGQPMRMMFRIKSFDEMRGFRRYFWKAAPAG